MKLSTKYLNLVENTIQDLDTYFNCRTTSLNIVIRPPEAPSEGTVPNAPPRTPHINHNAINIFMDFRLLDVQYILPTFQHTIIMKTENDPHKNLKNVSYLRLRTWTGLLASITQLVAILAARDLRASSCTICLKISGSYCLRDNPSCFPSGITFFCCCYFQR